MSENYCKDCTFYYQTPILEGRGTCTDPTKVIYDRSANIAIDSPEVSEYYNCYNFDLIMAKDLHDRKDKF